MKASRIPRAPDATVTVTFTVCMCSMNMRACLVCTWFEAGGENLASGTKALVPKVRVAHDTSLPPPAPGAGGGRRAERSSSGSLARVHFRKSETVTFPRSEAFRSGDQSDQSPLFHEHLAV